MMILVNLDPDVQFTVRVIDHEGFELYDGPCPIWPPLKINGPAQIEMTPHPRGCPLHAWVGKVNAGRFRAN